METNRIIEELRARASLNWNPNQKAFYNQIAKDARPVHCVRMRDVFTLEQLEYLRGRYATRQKACYKNAAELVRIITSCDLFLEPVRYVEGYVYSCGLLPIEHAFVKVGEHYIDPTFERALKQDVRKEVYAVCLELDPFTMAQYLLETGYYGGLYVYDYLCKNRPELAVEVRKQNPHNR